MSIPHPTTNTILRGWKGGYSSSASKSMEVTAQFFGPQLQPKSLPQQQQQQQGKVFGQHLKPKKSTHTLEPLAKHEQLLKSKQLPNLSTKSTDSTTSTENTSGSVSPGCSNVLQESNSLWLTPEHASKVPDTQQAVLSNVLSSGEMDVITNDRSNVQLNSNPFACVDPSLQKYQSNRSRNSKMRSPMIVASPLQSSAQHSGLESKNRFHEYYISSPPQSASAAFAGTTTPYSHSKQKRFTGLRILSTQKNVIGSQQIATTSATISSSSQSSLQKLPLPNRQSESGIKEIASSIKNLKLNEAETENAFWQRIDSICNHPQESSSRKIGREPQTQPKMELLNQEFSNKIERRQSAANGPSLVLPQLQGHLSPRHFSQGTSRKNKDTLMDFMPFPSDRSSIEEQYFNTQEVDLNKQIKQQQQSQKQLDKRTTQGFLSSESPVAYMNFSQQTNNKPLMHVAHWSPYTNELAETSFKSHRAVISPGSGVFRELHRRKYLPLHPTTMQRRNTIELQNSIQLEVIEDEEFAIESSTIQVLPQASSNEFEFSFCQSQVQEDSTEKLLQVPNSQQVGVEAYASSQLNQSRGLKQGPSRMRFNLKSRQQDNLVKKIFHFESSAAAAATTNSLAISGHSNTARKASTPLI